MTIYSLGTITFSKEVSMDKLKELRKNLEDGWYIDMADTLELDFTQTNMDIEDDLSAISDFAKENGLTVDGDIEYSGDDTGHYVFDNSADYEDMNLETYYLRFQSDNDILDVLERRKKEGKLLDALQRIKDVYGAELAVC